MKVTLSAIKRLIQTNVASDVTDVYFTRRPLNSTVIFYSENSAGLNGIVLRDNATGAVYAAVGRCNAVTILAGRGLDQ